MFSIYENEPTFGPDRKRTRPEALAATWLVIDCWRVGSHRKSHHIDEKWVYALKKTSKLSKKLYRIILHA